MKFLIGLALLSVAFATPLEPVSLPKPPAPAFETEVQMPKIAMPTFEIPDMRPLIIPQEVMEALMAAAPVDSDSLVDAVIVVENAEAVAPVAEDIVDPVRFVDVADNKVAEVPLDLTPVDENAVQGDGVIVVDHFDDVAKAIPAEETPVVAADPVRFVDAAVAADSDVGSDAVKIVDTPMIDRSWLRSN